MSSTVTWSASQLTVVFGTVTVDGFGPDDFITIEYAADGVTTAVGADGIGTFSVSQDRSGTVTIVLQPGSDANAVLSSQEALQRTDFATGVPLSIQNPTTPNGGSSFTTESIMVAQQAPMTFNAELGANEWTLVFVDGQMSHGIATAPV